MSQSLAYFRGQIVPIEQANVNVMTHALHYGTAVFEGIRGNWSESEGKMFVFRMREHYVRLLQGCKMLMMDIGKTADELCAITENLINECGYKQDLYIRPLAYKSEELVANLKLQDLSSDFTLIMVPFGAYLDSDGALNCCTSSWRRVDDTIIPPRVKISGHYVNSILAKTEATLAGFDEAIMLTPDGFVSEVFFPRPDATASGRGGYRPEAQALGTFGGARAGRGTFGCPSRPKAGEKPTTNNR